MTNTMCNKCYNTVVTHVNDTTSINAISSQFDLIDGNTAQCQ